MLLLVNLNNVLQKFYEEFNGQKYVKNRKYIVMKTMTLQLPIHLMNSVFELEAYLGREQTSMIKVFCKNN